MASTRLSPNGRISRANGDTKNEHTIQSEEASEENRTHQQCKIDKTDNDHAGTVTMTVTSTHTTTTATTTNSTTKKNTKINMTGDNEVIVSRTQASDKIQQRTSNSAVYDTKGIDNDKYNSNNEGWRKNEIKYKQQPIRAQNTTNNEVLILGNGGNSPLNTNDSSKQQRRNSSSSRTTLSGSQQRVGGDVCSGTTTLSKFKEKRPEPLKLSSNLNQEIPLDLSVRSASNVPSDASGSVFSLLCSNQLTTLETPRILWQDNELLMETGAPNITSSTSMALSPLASSGMPIESASKLRLFSSTSSSASMTMASKRKTCGDRNIPTSVGVPNTPMPLTPSTPMTPDSVAAAAAAAHLAAANRLASMSGNGVDQYNPLALTTNLPISPARTHHLARNLMSSAETSCWSQPPRRSCSTENLSSLLTTAASKLSSPIKSSTTMTNSKTSLQSATATRRLLDALRHQHQRTAGDLLSASLDHSGTKRISPLATNSLTATQQDKTNVASNNMHDATDNSRSHSSASTSSGSRFSYSSQQIAAARLAQQMQQQHQSPTIALWSKSASINSPRGFFSDNNNNSSNVSPLTPTNVANATANLLNIRLNSPNSSSNHSTSNIESLGSTNNESQQSQKPMSVSFSSISDFLAASTVVAAAAANIAQTSPNDSSQHQQQHFPVSTTKVVTTVAASSPIVDPQVSSITYCQSSIGSSPTMSVVANNASMNGGCSSTVTRLTQQSASNNNSGNQLSGCAPVGGNSTTLNTPTLISPNQLKAGHLCFLPSPTLSPLSSVFELPSPLLMFPPTSSVNTIGTSHSSCRDDATKTNVASTTGVNPKGLIGTSKTLSGVASNSGPKVQSNCSSATGSSSDSSAAQPIMSVDSNSTMIQDMAASHACPMGNGPDNRSSVDDKDKRVRYDAQPSDRFAQLITTGEEKLATVVASTTASATPAPERTVPQEEHVQANMTTRMEVDIDDVNVDDDVDDEDEDDAEDINANQTDLDNSPDGADDNANECLGGGSTKCSTSQRHLGRQQCRQNRRRRCGKSPWARVRKLKQTITMKELVCQQRLCSPNRPATAVPRILVSESNRSQQQMQQNLYGRANGAALINASSLNTGLNRIEAQQQKRQQRDLVDKRALSPKSFRARISMYHNKRHESSSAPPEVVVALGECSSCANGNSSTYGRHTPKAKLKTLSTMDACTSSFCVHNCNNNRLIREQQPGFNSVATAPEHGPQQSLSSNRQQQSMHVSVWIPNEPANRSQQQQSSSSQNSLPASNSVDSISGSRCSASWNSSTYYQQQQALRFGEQFHSEFAVRRCKPVVSNTASTPHATIATLTPTESMPTDSNDTSLALTTFNSQTSACSSIQGGNAAMRLPRGCCTATLSSNFDGCSSFASSYWLSHSAQQLSHQASVTSAAQQQENQIQRSVTTHWESSTVVPPRTSLMSGGAATFGVCENAPPARAISTQVSASSVQSISVGDHLNRCGSITSGAIACERPEVDDCLANNSSTSVTANVATQSSAPVPAHWLRGGDRMRQTQRNLTPGRFDHAITKSDAATALHTQIEPYSTRSLSELTIEKISNLDQSPDCSAFEQVQLERSLQQYPYSQLSIQSSGSDCSPALTSGDPVSVRRGSALGSRTVSATPTKMILGASSMASTFSTGSDTALASATSAITVMANGATSNSRPDSVASINSSISLDLESFKNVGLSIEKNQSSLSSTPNRHHHTTSITAQHQYSLSRPSSAASNNTQLSCGSSGCITIRRHRHCTTPQNRTGSSASSCASSGAPKKYHCDQCSKSFTRSDMLTRHRRLHSGDRPFQCNECKQEFSRSDHLSTHMRTHTGEKPYKCKLCCYSACRKDMITRHMKVHSRVQAQIQHASRHPPTSTSTQNSPYQSLQLLYNQQQ